jgi:hypothetical protein
MKINVKIKIIFCVLNLSENAVLDLAQLRFDQNVYHQHNLSTNIKLKSENHFLSKNIVVFSVRQSQQNLNL